MAPWQWSLDHRSAALPGVDRSHRPYVAGHLQRTMTANLPPETRQFNYDAQRLLKPDTPYAGSLQSFIYQKLRQFSLEGSRHASPVCNWRCCLPRTYPRGGSK